MVKTIITKKEYDDKVMKIELLKSELTEYEVVDGWQATADEKVLSFEKCKLTISANRTNWAMVKNQKVNDIFYISIEDEYYDDICMSLDKDSAKNLVNYITEKLEYLEGDN